MQPRSETSSAGEDLRQALAHVPTAVTVVTTLDSAGPHGTTVSAFCSLSARPPLVLVALDRDSNVLRRLRGSARFGVNSLSAGQEDIARICASKDPEKFAGVPWSDEEGVPRIALAASWFRCEVEVVLPGGDHEIVVGHVLETASSSREPLIYHQRRFGLPSGVAA